MLHEPCGQRVRRWNLLSKSLLEAQLECTELAHDGPDSTLGPTVGLALVLCRVLDRDTADRRVILLGIYPDVEQCCSCQSQQRWLVVRLEDNLDVSHELHVSRDETRDVVVPVTALHWHVVGEDGLRLMAAYSDTLHDLQLGAPLLELGVAIFCLRELLLELLPAFQVATTGYEPLVQANTRHVVWSAGVAPALLA